jgi:hypothetical protein
MKEISLDDWKRLSPEWGSARKKWAEVSRKLAAGIVEEEKTWHQVRPHAARIQTYDNANRAAKKVPIPVSEFQMTGMRVPWDELDGMDWVILLSNRPSRADRCRWERLNGDNWATLLAVRPQFEDKCAWEKLGGRAWSKLLSVRPRFAKRCPWEKLGESDWKRLLAAQPQLAGHQSAQADAEVDAGALLERFRTGLTREGLLELAGAAGRRLVPEGAQLGEWRVGGFLGRGGSAEVYCARHSLLGTQAALKVLWREEPQPKERFLREARFLAGRPGASFPMFLGAGETEGRPWMALELLEAYPLPSKDAEVAKYMLEVGAAVAALHAAGWLHRDIKPENVLRRADGHAVLADLGLLKKFRTGGDEKAGGGASTVSVVDGHPVGVGTPAYAAPEQFAGGEATPAMDVHALGILGNTCFGGNPPKDWKRILSKATNTVPGWRYPTVEAMMRAIQRLKCRKE